MESERKGKKCTADMFQCSDEVYCMFLKAKINWSLLYVQLKGLKQTNNGLYTTLLSAQPSSMSAALASVHNRFLKSLSEGENKGTGSLTCNQGLEMRPVYSRNGLPPLTALNVQADNALSDNEMNTK